MNELTNEWMNGDCVHVQVHLLMVKLATLAK